MCRLCSFRNVVSGKIFLLRNQDFLPQSLTSSRFAFKVEADRLSLLKKLKDLSTKDAEIRSKLRKNDGHKGKVNKKVLDWMDLADELHLESMNQLGAIYLYEDQGCCRYVYFKVDRSLLKLIHEVKILVKHASSLVISEHVPVQSHTDFVPTLAPTVFEELWNSLMDPRIGIIGLYGTGGVGKTTIMKNIVDQLALANTETFDNIVWVTLSARVNWERVRDDIAMQLSIGLPELLNFSLGGKDMDHMVMEKVKKEKRRVERGLIMSEHLRNVKRCLFIIDDMWAPIPHYDIWKDHPDYKKWKSRPDRYQRPTHSIPQSFRHTIIPEPTEDNGCKVVITTRYQYVCEKMGAHKQMHLAPLSQNEAWELFIIRCGDHVLDLDIQNIAREVAVECGGLPLNIITIGHALRGESNAAAWELALMDLRKTRRGICYEDYIYIEGDRVGSINLGEEILRELKDANMLEMFVEDGNECYKMHGLFKDLAISITRNEHNFWVEAGQRLSYFPDCYTVRETHVKLISAIRNDIEKHYLDRMYSSLSTLLLRDNPLSLLSSGFFYSFPNLEFLDMSYTGIREIPSSLCELTRLRVLFLGYCTNVKKMPSLEKLKGLQVLNLCGTLIKELPEGMKCLSKLRSLDLSETVRLEDIQDGVLSSLSNLEELRMQGSRICKSDSPTVAARLMEIRCLKKLSILTLSAVGFGDHLDTILYLQGYNLKVYSINSYGTSQDYVEDF